MLTLPGERNSGADTAPSGTGPVSRSTATSPRRLSPDFGHQPFSATTAGTGASVEAHLKLTYTGASGLLLSEATTCAQVTT